MESHLHWADYLILVAFLVISLGIGIYHSLTGGRQRTIAEFIMANRRLKVIPTSISLLVSFHSAMLYLGLTFEMYCFGIQYLIYFIATAPLAFIFIERIIVPWLYPLKLVSIYDYLEMRYSSKIIRIFGASLGISMSILLMGGSMYAPSAALESATGLPLSVSIPLMAVVTVVYTALGLSVVGGISNVFRLAGEEGRLIWASFSFDPRERNTVWSITIGMGFNWIQAFGFTQTATQRYSAVNTLSKARTTMLILIPPLVVMDIVAGIIGLIVFAYYANIKCDPLVNKDIANPNMLLPNFVVTIFADSPGFSGLFLATLYGATLSTVSSLLSGSAANCWEDILKWKLNHLEESRKTFINKLLVVLFGTLAIGVAFISASFPGPITQVMMAMFSSVTGPLVAIFVLGGISKRTNWKGALLGGIVGVLMTLWLSIGSLTHKHPTLPPVSVEQCLTGNGNSTFVHASMNYTKYTSFNVAGRSGSNDNWNQTTGRQETELRGLENFYAISYLWLTSFGAVITAVVAVITSFITRNKDLEAKVDERLLMRFRFCGWSDENENQERADDENCTSLRETKVGGLNGTKDCFLQDMEMTDSYEAQNRFHEDINGDLKKETEDS